MTGCPGPETRRAGGERAEMLSAVFELVLERGYEATTAELVCERAKVAPEALEREFGDVRGCVEAIYIEIDRRFAGRVERAYASRRSWREALRAAAYAAADYFEENPRQLRFGMTALGEAGETVLAQRDANLLRFVDMIDAGRCELEDPGSVGRGAAESAIGAIFERLLRAAGRGGVSAPRDFVPEMMYLAVRPYVGHAEAMKEFSIPPPPPVESAG